MSYEETFEHNGFTIRLTADEWAENPGDWGRDDVFLVGFHRDFSVQYENESVSVKSKGDAFWLFPKAAIIKHLIEGERYEPEDAKEEAEAGHVSGYTVYPLQAYSHGGVHLSLDSFECPRDSGQVGWVFVKDADHRDDFGEHDKARRRAAQGIVDQWNQFLSGDVWTFMVEDSDGEVLESCGGIYGMEDALEAAKAECPPADATKEVPVKILHTDGTWVQSTGIVPVYVGDSQAPEWLMESAPADVEEIVLSAAKAAKESVA